MSEDNAIADYDSYIESEVLLRRKYKLMSSEKWLFG